MATRTSIALLGAGGKMGCRITDNIRDLPEYEVRYVEIGEAGRARLAERGIGVTEQAEATADVDIVVLAVPDVAIGKVCKGLVPTLRPGTLVVLLDPAAAHAGQLPARDDISYFLAHPCHPPVFNDETSPEARFDWFGASHAKQNVVCALHSGREEDYARGEALARAMYAPVMRAHRVSTDQMALLEPALVESLTATCITVMKEGMDEVVRQGVPPEAAWDFLAGHIRIELAVTFGIAGFPLSDGALLAIEKAKERIFRPDWKTALFDPGNVRQSVKEIAG
ncbi:MAG TPA: phosphogluconate dehydrogenase C-terminal domain-containing protein [Chloroflexota bacterium]